MLSRTELRESSTALRRGSDLNANVGVGLPPIENGLGVELGVAILLEDAGLYGFVLTVYDGIDVRGCSNNVTGELLRNTHMAMVI